MHIGESLRLTIATWKNLSADERAAAKLQLEEIGSTELSYADKARVTFLNAIIYRQQLRDSADMRELPDFVSSDVWLEEIQEQNENLGIVVKSDSPARTEIQQSIQHENVLAEAFGESEELEQYHQAIDDTRWTRDMTATLVEAAGEYKGTIKWEEIRTRYKVLSGFSAVRLRERHRNIVQKIRNTDRRNVAYIQLKKP